MKYLYLLLFLFLFKEANSQIFERTYQTAPLNYMERALTGIIIGENTIVAIKEDSVTKTYSKLIKLDKNGQIIKTQYLPNDKNYTVVELTNINDTCLFVFLMHSNSSNLFICKIDTNLNIQWFKYAGYFNCVVEKVKRINNNKFTIAGKFYKNGASPSSYLFIDTTGEILNYNSTFAMYDQNAYAIDVIETNDTVYSVLQSFAYLNTNGIIITSKRKNESGLLNSKGIYFNSLTYGDFIEFDKEHIIVYGQNYYPNINKLKFKYTFDKNLNIIKIDSLKLSDGVNESIEYFAKDGDNSYYASDQTIRVTAVDKNFKVTNVQHIPNTSIELKSFSVNNNFAIITGGKNRTFKSPPGSYVHRFNPNAPLGVDNNNVDNFNLYPNPFNNEFSLSFDKEQAFVNLCIYNTLGQKMFNKRFEKTSSIWVDDLDLGKGVYVVEIVTEEGQLTKRIIKQ